MKRIALLVLVLAAGCDNTKPEERKLAGAPGPAPMPPAGSAVGSATSGAGSAAAGSGSAAAGSAAGSATAEAKGTGFAPFDDAMAGTKPWTVDDKAGIVELYANDDLSGRTKGRFTVERKCGADATRTVEAMGKLIAERRKDRDAPQCKEEGGLMSCFQPGIAEGDVVLELEYAKAGDAWRVIGAKTYGVGITAAKEEAKYAALLKEQCK